MAVPDTQTNIRLHPDEDLRRRDGVAYQCKFEGTYSVAEAKGIPVVLKACEQMREAKTKRRETGIKQAPMVAVHVSVQGIEVFSGEEMVTRTAILKVPIDKISYIARDPSDRHYLAVVYEKSPPAPTDKPEFECTLFKHDITKTREIVLTLNQAFDLAYEMRVKEGKIPKVTPKEQLDIYRSRLKQLSHLLPSEKLSDFLRLLNITEITEIRGLDAGKGQAAPHTLVTQASVDVLGSQPSKPPTPTAAPAAASSAKQAQPLLQTATAAPAAPSASANKPSSNLIVDFGGDDMSWTPLPQQQQQQPPQALPQPPQALPQPPSRPAPNPFGGNAPVAHPAAQPTAAVGGFGDFFGAPFTPPAQPGAPPQQQSTAGHDLMRLGFGPLDADLEFDPLKMK